MLARLVQLKKALSPMLVTLAGMVTLVIFLHSSKALPPMLVTLFGMVDTSPDLPSGHSIKVDLLLL
jgi:hypothetical protein